MKKIAISSLLSAAILCQTYIANAENSQQPLQNKTDQLPTNPPQNQEHANITEIKENTENKTDNCTTLMQTILRKKPNFDPDNVIKQIEKGEKLEIIYETKNFYKVRYDNTEGYVTKISCPKNDQIEKDKTKSKVKYIVLSAPTSVKSLVKKYCMTPQQFIDLNRLDENTRMLEKTKHI